MVHSDVTVLLSSLFFPVYTKLASALPFPLPPRNVASLCNKTDLQHLSPDLLACEILFSDLDWICLLKEKHMLQVLESEILLKNRHNSAKSKENSLFFCCWPLCPLRTMEPEKNHGWNGPLYIYWSKLPSKVSPGLNSINLFQALSIWVPRMESQWAALAICSIIPPPSLGRIFSFCLMAVSCLAAARAGLLPERQNSFRQDSEYLPGSTEEGKEQANLPTG